MPLTKKGEKVKAAMESEYGSDKGKRIFYASENAGKIPGAVKTEKKEKTSKVRSK